MPLLRPTDALPYLPRRVLVAGPSGSGKTTVAGRVANILGIAHHELDALNHGPDWTVRPMFERDVHSFSAGPAWTTEWQYDSVRAHLLARADLMIWLDLPRLRVLRQVIHRTVRRQVRREVLWNGNIEPPLWTIFTDPQHVVRWSWTSYPKTPARMTRLLTDRPDLPVVRLRSRGDVTAWLADLTRQAHR